MMLPRTQRWRLGLGILLLGFASDRLSKIAILRTLTTGDQSQDILPFLSFTLVWNRGISYGLFSSDYVLAPYVLFGLSGLICFWLFWLMLQQTHRAILVGFALIIGGAMGNMYDRARFGAVVDFIHLHAGAYSWYIFNLADSWITVGVCLILYNSLRQQPN